MNEDIWREANIEPMTTFHGKNDCDGMVTYQGSKGGGVFKCREIEEGGGSVNDG